MFTITYKFELFIEISNYYRIKFNKNKLIFVIFVLIFKKKNSLRNFLNIGIQGAKCKCDIKLRAMVSISP